MTRSLPLRTCVAIWLSLSAMLWVGFIILGWRIADAIGHVIAAVFGGGT